MERLSPNTYDEGATHWHLDKRINVSHLIATLLLAISVFAWANGVDKRISVIESQHHQFEKENERQDKQLEANNALLRAELGEIKSILRDVERQLAVKADRDGARPSTRGQ